MSPEIWSVSDFVAVLNQTLEYAYPTVLVSGELANFRVSKNRWVYFDLKDDDASLRCFGTVYQLPGPLEDGMMLTVRAQPRLHPLYGFSLNTQAIQVSGEGSLKRAADLLAAKLDAEGLFAPERKRLLPYPPSRIGLITSGESAAYADFNKILNARWGGLVIEHADVQVQGEAAIPQIVQAIERFNATARPPEVLVLTRGGGSADDLAAFSAEPVVRAVAASRIPTLVAIGHEIDTSLAELAADQRASTPSNAAELLVPDRRHILDQLATYRQDFARLITQRYAVERQTLDDVMADARAAVQDLLGRASDRLTADQRLLAALSPQTALQRGFAIVRQDGKVVHRLKQVTPGTAEVEFADGRVAVTIKENHG